MLSLWKRFIVKFRQNAVKYKDLNEKCTKQILPVP